MISSASSTPNPGSTGALAGLGPRPDARPATLGADHLELGRNAALHRLLRATPESRPEAVARGRELAADPSYPSRDILRNVASRLLASPDLSESAE